MNKTRNQNQEDNLQNENKKKDTEMKTPNEKLEEVQSDKDKEIKNLYSQLLRLRAEFDNYRKRVEKEKNERFLYGKQVILSKIVEFTDVFDKAIEVSKDKKDIENVLSGLELLRKEFYNFLEKEGIKFINSVGDKIDPNLHEVIGYELTEDKEDGIILKEIQKGYKFDDHVLRPAKVIVSKRKQEENTKSAEENLEIQESK
ncbi:MAG: nucleotide exchange factor GrpE [Endomicrobiia bacterium]